MQTLLELSRSTYLYVILYCSIMMRAKRTIPAPVRTNWIGLDWSFTAVESVRATVKRIVEETITVIRPIKRDSHDCCLTLPL